MADNTGAAIGLTAGAIAFTNDWYVSGQIPWRIAVATPIAGAFLYGAGKISPPAATGLGLAILITVIMTPFSGQSPMQSVIKITGSGKK